MGFGDFLSGVGEAVGNVGEAVGGDWVVDQALKAPDATRHVLNAGEAVTKGVSHLVTNPTQIARGAGAAINFVQENPGQAWDVGFEISRAIVKDQLDPVNLAINAGLIAATVATGGAMAPALVAKLAMGARTGVTALRAGEGAIAGVRAARTGFQAARAASTAVKTARAADTAIDAAQTIDRATDIVKDVEHVRDAEKIMGRGDAFLGGTDVYGTATKGSKALNPISRHAERIMQERVRDPLATKILAGGRAGDEASAGRQILAAAVQGNTGFRPVQLARQSERAIGAQRTMWRGRQVAKKTVGYAQTAGSVQTGYDIAYDPVGYAGGKAEAGWAEHGDEITAQAEQSGLLDKVRNRNKDQTSKADVEERDYDPFEQTVATPVSGLMDFRLDGTRSTRTSKRRAGGPTRLGTVTKESTMPSQVGPSDWYGPQHGYKSGRGFASKPSTMPPLAQPRLGAV
jgi:plasmid stability protein